MTCSGTWPAVARHVAPGGLYIIELAHPADFFAVERRTSSEWSSEVGGGTVSVRWGGGTDEIDPITQITREHVSVTYSSGARRAHRHRRGAQPVLDRHRADRGDPPGRRLRRRGPLRGLRRRHPGRGAGRLADDPGPAPRGSGTRAGRAERQPGLGRVPGRRRPRAAADRLILAGQAVPQVAVQDGLHHLAQRAALVARRPGARPPQRMVDLDRQVRAEPVARWPHGGAGTAAAARSRSPAAAQLAGREPAADAPLHGLLADAEGLGQRAQRPARLAERGQRGRQQLAVPRRAQLAQPGRDALGQPGPAPGAGPPEAPGAPEGGTPCTYWRRPWVTTSDMVRPSRARRAFRRCRCSWSSRNVSSRLFAVIHAHPAAASPAPGTPGARPARPARTAADAPPAGSSICSAATSSR